MILAEVDHFLIDPGKSAFRHDGLGVLQPAVRPIHFPAGANHRRHGRINDHVIRSMQVGYTFCRVDHRHFGTALVTGVNIFLDFLAQGFRKVFDTVINTADTVVRVYAQFCKEFSVFGKQVLVENLDCVAENDRMRDLHHCCLHMQREHHPRFSRIFHLFFKELAQRLFAHEHAVDDLAFQQGRLFFQNDDLTTICQQVHFNVTGFIHRHAFFAGIEIAVLHVRNVCAGSRTPFHHRVWMFADILLYSSRRPPVGITFTQHRVDRAAQNR